MRTSHKSTPKMNLGYRPRRHSEQSAEEKAFVHGKIGEENWCPSAHLPLKGRIIIYTGACHNRVVIEMLKRHRFIYVCISGENECIDVNNI